MKNHVHTTGAIIKMLQLTKQESDNRYKYYDCSFIAAPASVIYHQQALHAAVQVPDETIHIPPLFVMFYVLSFNV